MNKQWNISVHGSKRVELKELWPPGEVPIDPTWETVATRLKEIEPQSLVKI